MALYYPGSLICRRRRRPQNFWCLSSLFGLRDCTNVRLFGVGGRTVHSPKENDLRVVSRFATDIVILEIGTNDLPKFGPEIVGSAIEDSVVYLRGNLKLRVVCFCNVILSGNSYCHSASFNNRDITLHYSEFLFGFKGVSQIPCATFSYQTAFTLIRQDSLFFVAVIGTPFYRL